MLENIYLCLNFFSIFLILFFIGSKKWYKNFLISIILSAFFTAELFSIFYFGYPINEEALFFIANLQIYHITFSTRVFMVYICIYLFVFLTSIFYVILKKFQIHKFKRYFIILSLIILFSPIGFIYYILHVFIIDYGYAYLKYRSYTYQEIFRMIKDDEYVERDKVKILNQNENYKNLVLIYLESYERNLLTNDTIKKYTNDINKLSKEGEFYIKMPQLSGSMGTTAGMFTTMCGSRLYTYSLFANPHRKVLKNHQFVCMPDILHKAGYKQVFIGGADKVLFNKGNLLLSHNYDVVEDKDSLVKQYPDLKDKLNAWGVADIDIFNIAKEKYKELSKSNKPFNLTILTTATHNVNGVHDDRCKNISKDNELLNAVECTNMVVSDFINFLKTQPNYKNTIIVILPDHVQYELNGLNDIIKNEETDLFTIILNSGIVKEYDSNIDYTNLAEIILDRLNVKSNAVFLNNPYDIELIKNFIHKIHFATEDE